MNVPSSMTALLQRSVGTAFAVLALLLLTAQPSDAHGLQRASSTHSDSSAMVQQDSATAVSSIASHACVDKSQCKKEARHGHHGASSSCCGQMCHSAAVMLDSFQLPYFGPTARTFAPSTAWSSAPSYRIYHPPRGAMTV